MEDFVNTILSRVLALLLPLALAMPAAAQYPNRVIKMIVPFQAGSSPDVVARTLGERLAAALGQAVVIDNRPGAGGNLGAEAAAKAPNDGYTLMLATISHASNPSLYRSVNYDPVRDFVPIALVARVPGLLVVPADSPVKSVADLIALAKAKPGALNYSSGGNGSQAHFAAEMFRQAAAIQVVHVPYKGAPEILNSLLSNQTAFAFPTFNTALPQVQAGKLRALAVTSPKRNHKLPDVPTIKEAMASGFELNAWFGVVAPAGTSADIVNRLNAEVARILRDPAMRERLSGDGTEVVTSSPDEFAAVIKADVALWADIVKRVGVRIE
jgi:tripartite-type tricarboxylate transporter receptor subunit TctC